jgi:hypothetical protein
LSAMPPPIDSIEPHLKIFRSSYGDPGCIFTNHRPHNISAMPKDC